MTTPAPRPGSWHWTAWDIVTALLVGIVSAIVAVFHQEELWVCLLSGLITAVAVFFIIPIGRLLRKQ